MLQATTRPSRTSLTQSVPEVGATYGSSFYDARVSPRRSKTLVPQATATTKVHLRNLSRRLAPRPCVTLASRRDAPRRMADLGTVEPAEVLSLPPNSTRPTDNSSLGLTASSGENCRAHGMERRNFFQARSSGLASASTSHEETIALPARIKPHDKCYNVVEASAESQMFAELTFSMTIP